MLLDLRTKYYRDKWECPKSAATGCIFVRDVLLENKQKIVYSQKEAERYTTWGNVA